jgi:hypothetical protein
VEGQRDRVVCSSPRAGRHLVSSGGSKRDANALRLLTGEPGLARVDGTAAEPALGWALLAIPNPEPTLQRRIANGDRRTPPVAPRWAGTDTCGCELARLQAAPRPGDPPPATAACGVLQRLSDEAGGVGCVLSDEAGGAAHRAAAAPVRPRFRTIGCCRCEGGGS